MHSLRAFNHTCNTLKILYSGVSTILKHGLEVLHGLEAVLRANLTLQTLGLPHNLLGVTADQDPDGWLAFTKSASSSGDRAGWNEFNLNLDSGKMYMNAQNFNRVIQ